MLQEGNSIFFDEAQQRGEFAAAESHVRSEGGRRQPEFGELLGLFDMDVGWLPPLVTEEEEAKSGGTENGRHLENLPSTGMLRQRRRLPAPAGRRLCKQHRDVLLRWLPDDNGVAIAIQEA